VISDILYAGVQGSYKSFEIAIFQGEELIKIVGGDKIQASSDFVVYFQKILKDCGKNLKDLSFIAVDQGPGAFTSLRVIISTVNGIAFSKKPEFTKNPGESSGFLVGVDGLDALAKETVLKFFPDKSLESLNDDFCLVSLLNAYNNEVYYGVYAGNTISKDYKKVDVFLDELSEKFESKKIIFTGNGAQMHRELIYEKFGDRIVEPFSPLLTCSAEQVGKIGFELWNKKENLSFKLKPLYLKSSWG